MATSTYRQERRRRELGTVIQIFFLDEAGLDQVALHHTSIKPEDFIREAKAQRSAFKLYYEMLGCEMTSMQLVSEESALIMNAAAVRQPGLRLAFSKAAG